MNVITYVTTSQRKIKILQITNVSIHLFTNAIINQESICAIDMDTKVHKKGWIIYNHPSPNPVQALLSENLSICELFDIHHKAVYYMFQGETATVGCHLCSRMTQINMVEGSGLGNSNIYCLGLWYSEHISYKTEHIETCFLAMGKKMWGFCGVWLHMVYLFH